MRRWLAAVALCVASNAFAQGVRVTGITAMQAVDLRPLVEDSVPIEQTSGSGPYRTGPDGQVVRCIPGEPYCRFRSSGSRVMAAPLFQDLYVAGWGLGQGISVQAHARLRGSLGGDYEWPRSDDAFDLVEGYAQYERGSFQGRLGRQWATGGLGTYNYDGASLVLRRGRAQVEAFGGRSLVAGLNEPLTSDEFAATGDLPPDEDGWLLGFAGRSPIGSHGAVGATWQRVIRTDRAALYSDRIAADASWRAFGGSADVAFAWDLSAQEVNDARLVLSRPLPRGFGVSVTTLRHRPYFESWTIWGAFSPVAFDELRSEVSWRTPNGVVGVDARGAYRWYGETNAGLESSPLTSDGWRAGIGAEWMPRQDWLVHGDYDVDIGFGASRTDIVAGARWMPDESRWLGVAASGLQHIYEFRVGTGRIVGLRAEGGTRITGDLRLAADAAIYSHHLTNGAPSPDWSQRRFTLRFDWTVGRDPGMTGMESRQ